MLDVTRDVIRDVAWDVTRDVTGRTRTRTRTCACCCVGGRERARAGDAMGARRTAARGRRGRLNLRVLGHERRRSPNREDTAAGKRAWCSSGWGLWRGAPCLRAKVVDRSDSEEVCKILN